MTSYYLNRAGQIIQRVEFKDGSSTHVAVGAEDPGYLAWLAEGNQPLPADEQQGVNNG